MDVNILLIFENVVLVISILLLILLSHKTSCDPRCVNSDTCTVLDSSMVMLIREAGVTFVLPWSLFSLHLFSCCNVFQ